ncbi:hypothetical protein OPQ81_006416 [Rhizoctonia solani]|nr:hypothetical protein OPQ81_006416 [Rhizoctonia solani]
MRSNVICWNVPGRTSLSRSSTGSRKPRLDLRRVYVGATAQKARGAMPLEMDERGTWRFFVSGECMQTRYQIIKEPDRTR